MLWLHFCQRPGFEMSPSIALQQLLFCTSSRRQRAMLLLHFSTYEGRSCGWSHGCPCAMPAPASQPLMPHGFPCPAPPLQVAGLLLKEYRDSFKGSPVAATWSYLKTWALDNLPPNPLITHETGVRGRKDEGWWWRGQGVRYSVLGMTLGWVRQGWFKMKVGWGGHAACAWCTQVGSPAALSCTSRNPLLSSQAG